MHGYLIVILINSLDGVTVFQIASGDIIGNGKLRIGYIAGHTLSIQILPDAGILISPRLPDSRKIRT